MGYQFIKPNTILQPFIKYYWILENSDMKKKARRQRIYPDGLVEMIYYYGDKYLKISKGNKPDIQSGLQITGQKKDFYDVQALGKVGLIAVVFKPNAASQFLNLPVSEIENISVSLEDIIGNRIEIVENELFYCKNTAQRIEVIEEFLMKQLKVYEWYDYNRINYCIERINKRRGIISVAELAETACLSSRQFNRKFEGFVGSTPKQFTKLVRFQYALYLQQSRSAKNLTDLALQSGYYDQAHFTNDFKSFTGYTPKEFFRICDPFSDYFF